MDYLQIKGLTVSTRIGVHAWEQQIDQRLLIDITIPADFSACEEQLEKTIDYSELCQKVTLYVESNTFKLIETVASHLADLIKKEFNLRELTVAVSKPTAVKNAANIQVVVSR
ncbi:MAG: dihydroneopterin aldolase [Tatlockia sp.]|nr:dihydroneopterin aldolase [Tatlockia sp.]